MPSALIRSPEVPKSSRRLGDDGFSLLEVIVALAIMALGYMTVLQLFSSSVRSVGMSDQYLQAVTLANSKLSELEMKNFAQDADSGTFKNAENYRWEMELTPHDSPLNDSGASIELSKVVLKVLWEDNRKSRSVELATLRLKGTAFPASDSLLVNAFQGGASSLAQDQSPNPTDDPAPDASQPDAPGSSGTAPGPRVSGAGSGSISGSSQSFNISGN